MQSNSQVYVTIAAEVQDCWEAVDLSGFVEVFLEYCEVEKQPLQAIEVCGGKAWAKEYWRLLA